jgi:hypothetical protein
MAPRGYARLTSVASHLCSIPCATAAVQPAQGAATAVGDREQLRSRESVDTNRLEQPHPPCQIPRWASTLLVDIELPAHQLESRWASAQLTEQVMKAQARTVASPGGGWMSGVGDREHSLR